MNLAAPQNPARWPVLRPYGKGLVCAALAALVGLTACERKPTAQTGDESSASATVIQANANMAKDLALGDRADFDDAKRGFIAAPKGQIVAADGTVLKDFDAYPFLNSPAPATVNPSLWRHAQLNAQVGLFKVTDGVYQLRGFDIANMTLIEGKTGWIVVDPLSARESAAFALAFARQHLGPRPVSALVLSHAHVDHFGGVLGVVSAQEAQSRKLPIVAAQGFMAEATSENIMVGVGMARRSVYQFGKNLPRSALGNVDTGLGKDVVYGAVGILPPTTTISQTDQAQQLDGVDFVFHNVPGAECPAELTFSIPSKKLYNGAELLAQTQHNLLPIRGAKVRDALLWSQYLQQALDRLGGIDIYIAQHNQPIWGEQRIRQFVTAHRDVYKYTHDQTVRLINQGYTAREIAEMVQLPKSLAQQLGVRGYYGDLRHNVKAVYQFYLGFYDGNPAHLNPLPPTQAGQRYVSLIGAQRLLEAAQKAYDNGEFRWAAELLNHAVFADGNNQEAKRLLIKTYQQMAYMSESATWRNAYLTAAQELRDGPPSKGIDKTTALDMLHHVPTERFLEAMAGALNGPKAEDKNWKINLVISDRGERYVLWLENAVLHFKAAPPAKDAHATLNLSHALLVKLLAGSAGAKEVVMSDELKVEGSRIDLLRFLSLFDKASGVFPIVTPIKH